MDLTPENRAVIDSMDYMELLRGWRFHPAGSPWFQGETGEYWGKRMEELKAQEPDHARISRIVGW